MSASGAIVSPICGHAQHLMEGIDNLGDNNQVHVHFLTSDEEFEMLGYSKVELCCHGCGASTLVHYNVPDDEDDNRHMEMRDAFYERHKLCPNHSDGVCMNYRSRFDFVDLTVVPKKKEGPFNGPRVVSGRDRSVPRARPEMAGDHRRPGRKETPKGHR